MYTMHNFMANVASSPASFSTLHVEKLGWAFQCCTFKNWVGPGDEAMIRSLYAKRCVHGVIYVHVANFFYCIHVQCIEKLII